MVTLIIVTFFFLMHTFSIVAGFAVITICSNFMFQNEQNGNGNENGARFIENIKQKKV